MNEPGQVKMAETEVLVALLPKKKDFTILQAEGWYRIPVDHTPRRWPPDYVAFYQPKAFGADAFRIRYFGKVAQIKNVKRHDLFPNEFDSANSNQQYHRIELERLESLPRPIPCRMPRPIVFISTIWNKFIQADELNDLYDESPLEDLLWKDLKQRRISAQRQWLVSKDEVRYYLDFALFCQRGKLDVETDGDTWHLLPERVALDNRRNNDIEAQGWHVLRFNGNQIHEQRGEYCLPRIQDTINTLGGLVDDGLVPRKFFDKGGDAGQQLSLFEQSGEYLTDDGEPTDLD